MWFKKAQEDKSNQNFHGFFSVSIAREFGFWTVLNLHGQEVDVTKLLKLNAKQITYEATLQDDAVYIGVCTGKIIRDRDRNTGKTPKLNGVPVENWDTVELNDLV